MHKKTMYRIISFILIMSAVAIYASGCTNENKKPSNPTADISGVSAVTSEDSVATIAIFSDVHIGKKNTTPEAKFERAMAVLPKLAPNLDAICFGGDITDQGTDAQYKKFLEILNEHIDTSIPKLYCMGNHEYFRDGVVRFGGESKAFLEECKTAYKNLIGDLDTHKVINGVHVITVSARNSAASYEECEKFLIDSVEEAVKDNPNLPIIIVAHQGAGSFFEGGNAGYTAKTIKCLQKYPQIIFFSGHTHFALQDVRMIQQDKYTTMQTSTLGADFWNYSTVEEDQPENAAVSSQGIIIQVKENGTTEIIRYDFTNGKTIGSTLTVDYNNFTHIDSQRKKAAGKPSFAQGAVLEAKPDGSNKVVLKFPAATLSDNVSEGIIFSYRIRVTDVETGSIVHNKYVMSDYYMGTPMKSEYAYTVTGLKAGGKYTASVTAVSVFDKRSEVITAEFTLPNE